MRALIVKLMPKALHGLLFGAARSIRVNLFGIPDPMCDLQRLRDVVKPDAVLDIGAHVGQTAKEFRQIFPTEPIHCFEPTSATFRTLKENTATLANVSYHNVAIGNTDGETTFFTNANSQTNSLLDNDEGNTQQLAGLVEHVGKEVVKVQTLETWFRQSQLPPNAKLILKADVQGAENLLIDGGMDVFRNNVAIFYTEIGVANLYQGQASLKDILERMERCGLVPYQFYRTRSGDAGQALWFDAMWYNPALVTLRA